MVGAQPFYKMPEQNQLRKGGKDRGRDYNHSTYNDLIITGLVGLRPRLDHWVEINPLVPDGAIDYFCLDGVRYHDYNLTILYDKTGERYRKGRGLHAFIDGREIGSASGLAWMRAKLPQTGAGWRKYEGNPLIGGGEMGTVFDIAVLREDASPKSCFRQTLQRVGKTISIALQSSGATTDITSGTPDRQRESPGSGMQPVRTEKSGSG
jgi:hypothetical protein